MVMEENLWPELKPYPPSYIDRFMKAIERLPIPYWLTYLVLFILESAIFHVLSWIDGWLPAYTISSIIFVFPLWLWGPLAIITYLNSVSREALTDFAPLLNIQAEPLQRLKYEFTTMPTRSVIISDVLWGGFYLIFAIVAFPNIYAAYGTGSTLVALNTFIGLITYSIGSIIYYHSIRQLRLINLIVKRVEHFNVFQLEPVYAFSQVTSRTGIGWVMLLSFTLLAFPVQLAANPMLILLMVQVILALAAFVLPLQFVHPRLVTEKRRLQAELNQRVETTLARLHHSLDDNKLSEVNELNGAITGLNAEREILAKIPTWPWRAGMLTGFLSIVVLPIVLFLIQLVLGRLLGN